MTKYEARFYLQNPEAIWGLGRAGGSTKYTTQQILSGQAGDFIDSLFDQLFNILEINRVIKFEQTDTTKYRVFFEKGREEMIIYLWVGERNPEVKILKSEKMGQRWLCQMEQGAQFFINQNDTFLVLINRYLQECFAGSPSKEYFLRFEMIQGELYLPPTVISCLVPMTEIPANHQEELNGAPVDMLLCELISPNGRGYYIRIKKDKKILTEDDIEMV